MNTSPTPDSHAQSHALANQHFGIECPAMSRRDALRCGLVGVTGLMVADRLAVRAFAAPPPAAPKAKSFIQIWLWGGPCHLDTFDPKPGSGNDYTGPFTTPIKTKVAGLQLCELLPELAKQADKYSVIRSMTHNVNAHETASYMVQTGRMGGGRDVYPGVGAVVSLFKGYDAGYSGLIPPYVVMTELQGRFSEAGFLGPRYRPFATGGDPGRFPFAVEGVVAQGISEKRQQSRRELLGKLNLLAGTLPADPQIKAMARNENDAYDLILGDAGKVFDVSSEKEDVKDRYGRNTFGQSCLIARRLVERGVPYITINFKGWDTHKQHFQIMRQKLPQLDKGVATLLQDLADRGLLSSTVVWCSGEFGRTPKILWEPPWNGGRNHFGRVFSALVAGGGFKGGHVVGASDARGEEVKDRPVYPADLIATFYDLLGIDHNARLPHPEGLPVKVTPTADEGLTLAGRLAEIT
jgi:hypothetical protein